MLQEGQLFLTPLIKSVRIIVLYTGSLFISFRLLHMFILVLGTSIATYSEILIMQRWDLNLLKDGKRIVIIFACFDDVVNTGAYTISKYFSQRLIFRQNMTEKENLEAHTHMVWTTNLTMRWVSSYCPSRHLRRALSPTYSNSIVAYDRWPMPTIP